MEEQAMTAELTATEDGASNQTDVYDGWEDTAAPDAAEPEIQAEHAQAQPEEPEPAAEQTTEEEAGQAKREEDIFLTLKHNHTDRTVSREEAQALAQKGLEYDRVKGKLDEALEFQSRVGPAVDLLEQYAQKNGMNLEEYLDFCRKQELMQTGLTEEQAKSQISLERRESAVQSREAEVQAQQQAQESAKTEAESREEAVRRDIQAFMQDYPGVDAKDIPQEVWADMMQNKTSMSVAYGKFRIKALEREVEAAKSTAAAKEKTTGSLSGSLPTNGAADPVFEGWEE